ncbi:hypothetical protein GQR58_001137 [Nymphon striatum]|nr:hypothetical protein GQR58_001137 [Nymphon striatum]
MLLIIFGCCSKRSNSVVKPPCKGMVSSWSSNGRNIDISDHSVVGQVLKGRLNWFCSSNKCTVMELLHDLFLFYSEFDFTKYVICLRYATLKLKESFTVPEEEKSINFQNFAMGVQDPFEPNRNITRSMSAGLVEKFQKALKNICLAFTAAPGSENFGLAHIYKTGESITPDKAEKQSKGAKMKLTPSGIPKNAKRLLTINKGPRYQSIHSQDWKDKLASFLMLLLKHVMQFECDILPDSKIDHLPSEYKTNKCTISIGSLAIRSENSSIPCSSNQNSTCTSKNSTTNRLTETGEMNVENSLIDSNTSCTEEVTEVNSPVHEKDTYSQKRIRLSDSISEHLKESVVEENLPINSTTEEDQKEIPEKTLPVDNNKMPACNIGDKEFLNKPKSINDTNYSDEGSIQAEGITNVPGNEKTTYAAFSSEESTQAKRLNCVPDILLSSLDSCVNSNNDTEMKNISDSDCQNPENISKGSTSFNPESETGETPINSECDTKLNTTKRESGLTENNKYEKLFCLECKSFYPVWDNRKKMKRKSELDSYFENQVGISETMKLSMSKEHLFTSVICAYYTSSETKQSVILTAENTPKKITRHMNRAFSFISSFLPACIDHTVLFDSS